MGPAVRPAIMNRLIHSSINVFNKAEVKDVSGKDVTIDRHGAIITQRDVDSIVISVGVEPNRVFTRRTEKRVPQNPCDLQLFKGGGNHGSCCRWYGGWQKGLDVDPKEYLFCEERSDIQVISAKNQGLGIYKEARPWEKNIL